MAKSAEHLEFWSDCFSREIGEVREDLIKFENLLQKWQVAQNLVSRETLPEFWTRHVEDSLQLLPQFRTSDRHILDLGSGGGLPVIPIAITSKGMDRRFVAIEANQRKVSFLNSVKRTLSLQLEARASRIEELMVNDIGQFDVITSRALANLTQLFEYAHEFLLPDGRMVLHKGREYVEEVESARDLWQFDMVDIPSRTSPDGVVLIISKLSRNR